MDYSTKSNTPEIFSAKAKSKKQMKNKLFPKFLVIRSAIINTPDKKDGSNGKNSKKIINLNENFVCDNKYLKVKLEYSKDKSTIDKLFDLKKLIKMKKKTII